MSAQPVTTISSMATRALLEELAATYAARHGQPVTVESVGGVDAARRVAAGEAFDVVVLAADALKRLADGAHVEIDTITPWVRSSVQVAVPSGSPHPDLSSETSLRNAVLAADRVGYSTGPSGVALQQLFDRWGVTPALADRTVQAKPGVPVAALIARGEVTLGFQQLSELMNVPGVDVVGPMPPDLAIVTTFSGACGRLARQRAAALSFLRWLASAETAEVRRRHGMDPA